MLDKINRFWFLDLRLLFWQVFPRAYWLSFLFLSKAKKAVERACRSVWSAGFPYQAKTEGKPEIAMRHIEEAKKRLAGVKEWYDVGVKLLAAEKPEPMVEAVMELLLQHHRSTLEKIATFKPGA